MKPNYPVPPYKSAKIVPGWWIGVPMNMLRRATILVNLGLKPD